jgi:hypothetical protein
MQQRILDGQVDLKPSSLYIACNSDRQIEITETPHEPCTTALSVSPEALSYARRLLYPLWHHL